MIPSLWSQSANWLHPIHLCLIITWGFVMYWNSSAIFTMHLFQMFAWSSVNRLTIASKCFVGLLANIISVEHIFEWHTFQKWLCVGSRWVLPEKQQKMWVTIVELVHTDCYQSVSSHMIWIGYIVCWDILMENLNIHWEKISGILRHGTGVRIIAFSQRNCFEESVGQI